MPFPPSPAVLQPSSAREAAEALLRSRWGHDGFRPGQWEAIEAGLEGRDVLAILPTGGGKSVCYQLPALLLGGLTLVVSPLIALMQDQVTGLTARGVPAAFINSSLTEREIDQRWTDAEFGRYRLLYVAPERLESEMFRARAARLKVRLLAVDEAHCVSEWGHHFRPSYLKIAEARALLGDPPTIAVTATATPEVRRDVREHLGLRAPVEIVRGFDRPNLTWAIYRGERKAAKLLEILRAVPGTAIVYTGTRRRAVEWAERLGREGFRAEAYHGGLAAEARSGVQARWLSGETRVIVATNAFGMGIDKPDVRVVVHVDLPGSLEAYYQEAGRAGRDGRRSYAVLLFHTTDEEVPRRLIEESHAGARVVQAVYRAAGNLAQIPLGVLPEAPVRVDVDAVARLAGVSRTLVASSVELLFRQEVWRRVPGHRHLGRVRFLQPIENIRGYADGQPNRALARFVAMLLRTVHADAFSGWWEVDVRLLARRCGLSRTRLFHGLAFLEGLGLLSWQPPDTALWVEFTVPRSKTLAVDDLLVRRARRRAEARLESMLRYARSPGCRRHFLLGYFGERSPERCGRCDVCLGRHEPPVVTPLDEPLLKRLLEEIARGTARESWLADDPVAARRLDALLDWLLQEAYLSVREPLHGTLALTPKAHELMAQSRPRG